MSFSTIVAVGFTLALGFFTRAVYLCVHNGSAVPNSRPKKLLILLGSGGHTGEMFRLLRDVDLARYNQRIWVHGEDDKISADKAVLFEKEKSDVFDAGDKNKGNNTIGDSSPSANGGYVVISTPRARHVGESWISTTFSSAKALTRCFGIILKYQPSVIVTNGPGTSVMLCLAAFILKVLLLGNCRLVYFESLARVSSLSLSGKLLLPLANQFVVQWPQLAEKYKKAQYHGTLV